MALMWLCRSFLSHELQLGSLALVTAQVLFLQVCRGHLELRIAYITTNHGKYVSNGSIPAVMLALDEVNKAFSGRFGLQMNISSISCDRTNSLRSYFEALQSEGAPLIALLGCGCSPATEPVAEISYYADIIHMSYVSSSPILSDRSRFQSFWRTYPSDTSVMSAFLTVIKHYGWSQVKILTQEETLFIESTRTLTMKLRNNGFVVDQAGALMLPSTENIWKTSAEMLFTPEIRVFVLNMYQEQARRVLCQAVNLGNSDRTRYVPGYVWILHGWYKQHWWTEAVADDDANNCSDEELEALLKNSISIVQIPAADSLTAPTDVELTAEQFKNEYVANLGRSPSEPAAALAYDALWALARALNQSDYTNESTTRDIVEDMHRILSSSNFSFAGVSGTVKFDGNGSRLPHDTRVLQYRDTSECFHGDTGLQVVQVAVISERSGNLTYKCGTEACALSCESENTVWPNGVPVDGTPSKVITTIKTPIFIVYAMLATVGIVFVIVCLIFNIVFRERKIVKLTSPNLNYVVLFGAFTLYGSIYFYVLPSERELTSTLYCHIRAWLQPGGYFFCFGTILFKMWRVYYIFHNPSARKKRRVPKDWMLFLGVLVLVSVFVVVMIGATIFDDYKATEVDDQESRTERDENNVLVEHYNLVCEGKKSIIWIALLLSYSLLTQIAAVYLAFRTRKVKIVALNDAKYLAFIIYISSVILTGMMIAAVGLRNYLNADAAVFSTGLFLFTSCILGLLFVPKMIILYKDPHGELIFNRSMSQVQGTMTGMSLNDSEREKLRDLEVHCRDIETRLGKHENVRPFRSLSKTKLASSSTDFSTSMQLTSSTSISKPQQSDVGTTSSPCAIHPSTPPSSGYSSAGGVNDVEEKEAPEAGLT